MFNGKPRFYPRSKPRTGGTARRRDAVRTIQKQARARVQAKARKAPVRAIAKNTLAINKLKSQMYGSRQYQTSTMYPTLPLHVTSGSPLLFQVDNPNTGNKGPYVWHVNALGNVQHTNNRFNVWNDPAGSAAGFHDHEDLRLCNGPTARLNFVDLQFEFSGFVDATRIHIHVIRQKRMDTDFWNQNYADKFLPQTLTGLKNIAGFNPNRISYKDFEVLATKKIFMNSKGQANVIDTAQDRNTTDATTASVKYAHINLKLNKVIKQLNSSVN